MMRWLRTVALVGLVCKATILGVWTWGAVARAQAQAEPAAGTDAAAVAAAERARRHAGEAQAAGVEPELFVKSRGFRDMLEAVRKRGEELDAREQALKDEAAAAKRLQDLVGGEIARLEGLAGGGGAPGTVAAGSGEVCGVVVTKIYQSMSPDDAGAILDRLDDATVARILGCMKEKQVAAILAAMNRERAVALTRTLSGSAAN